MGWGINSHIRAALKFAGEWSSRSSIIRCRTEMVDAVSHRRNYAAGTQTEKEFLGG
jgi:hypothetical protein